MTRDVLSRMMEVMGEMPDDSRRVPLDARVVEESPDGGMLRRKLTFAVEPSDRCWAWLLMPEACLQGGAQPRPAMLCLHQTTAIGKGEPVGLGGLANLHYALELAQRGYVTLSPDYPNYGDYRVDPYALGYASGTMKGIWNHMRAMDLLCSLPQVDPQRIGCIGHSLGGHNTLFLAAFDPRVRVAVSSAGFTLFTWNDDEGRGKGGDLSDWSHNGYMPRIRERYGCRAEKVPFDWDEVIASIAPRAVFINAPEGDCMRVEGVRECVKRVAPVYARAGAPDRLMCLHPEGGHDFPPAVRQEAYRFIDRVLDRRG